MAVNPKEKKQLQKMWGESEVANQDLPDGTYQFKIVKARFHMTDKGKPTFKTLIKVVGGSEEYQGKELEINDNLETSENMGWFKKKLQRLNIAMPEDFDEVLDGTVSDEMKGKTFEGQVKTKNDFLNVYVNRLIGETPVDEEEETETQEDEDEESSVDFEEGDQVEWKGKTGEVVEVLEDEGQARVRREDGTVVRVALDLLSKPADEEDEEDDAEDDEEEEAEESDEFELPEADEVADMSAPEVKKALKAIGLEADNIKSARKVLRAFCALAENPKAKIGVDEIAPLAAALDVKLKKGAKIKDSTRLLAKAVKEALD